MQERPPLSVIIITLNEAHNIERCLESVLWAEDVIVVDSGSTDATVSLARKKQVRVETHPWEGYGQQKNHAMSLCQHEWVLSIDADEVVTPELRADIEKFLLYPQAHVGAMFPRKTWFLGRWILHGGWYPNYCLRLVKRSQAKWTTPAVHETLQANGPVAKLDGDLLHYTFRSIGEQVQTNIRFAKLGAEVAKQRGDRASYFKILLKPIGKFLETYLWKLGFLDGFPGFVISINAAHSIFMKYAELRFETHSCHRQ